MLDYQSMLLQTKGNLIFGHGSSVGRVRDHNEDYHRVKSFGAKGSTSFFAVADGMGGAAAGERASKTAIEVVSKAISDYVEFTSAGNKAIPLEKALERAMIAANKKINREALENPELSGMGTTITACVAVERQVIFGHVGDSRAYLVRNGEIKQITKDHSWVGFQVEHGIMTFEEAQNHPNRNQLMRALGTRAEVLVDTGSISTKLGDVFLLSSDGLHGFVEDHEFLAELDRKGLNLNNAVDYFIGMANSRGGLDNITCVLAQVVA
jgi:PPM family protein phosphatase